MFSDRCRNEKDGSRRGSGTEGGRRVAGGEGEDGKKMLTKGGDEKELLAPTQPRAHVLTA